MTMPVRKKQNVTILGATGSVGVNTLDVLALHPDRYDLYALTANSNWETLAEQCCAFKPKFAVLKQRENLPALEDRLLQAGCKTKVLAKVYPALPKALSMRSSERVINCLENI